MYACIILIFTYIHISSPFLYSVCDCREARFHEGRSLCENASDSLQILSLQMNCTGSHVSILCRQVSIDFEHMSTTQLHVLRIMYMYIYTGLIFIFTLKSVIAALGGRDGSGQIFHPFHPPPLHPPLSHSLLLLHLLLPHDLSFPTHHFPRTPGCCSARTTASLSWHWQENGGQSPLGLGGQSSAGCRSLITAGGHQ